MVLGCWTGPPGDGERVFASIAGWGPVVWRGVNEAIEAHLTYGATLPSPQTATLIFPIDGACHRVPAEATAVAYRDARFATGLGASYADPADDAVNVAWSRDYAAALRPFSEPGGYVGFDMDVGQDRSRRTTGSTTPGSPR